MYAEPNGELKRADHMPIGSSSPEDYGHAPNIPKTVYVVEGEPGLMSRLARPAIEIPMERELYEGSRMDTRADRRARSLPPSRYGYVWKLDSASQLG